MNEREAWWAIALRAAAFYILMGLFAVFGPIVELIAHFRKGVKRV